MSKFKPSLVCVDDVQTNLDTMKYSLEMDFTVHAFLSPQEALKELPKINPMIILSDMQMPLMNGVEFLELAHQCCPLSKNVIITGYSDENLVIAAINRASVFDFIRKPLKKGHIEQAMIRARSAYLKDEEEARVKRKAMSPDLMEHPSWLNKITTQLRSAFEAMPQYKVSNRQFEDWSILIHLAMSAEKRYYHNTEHLFDVWEDITDPYARLAVLFHDVVYAQIDKNSIHGMLPKIVEILGPMIPTADLTLTLPLPDQFTDSADVSTLYHVFGVKPGSILTTMNGMNEFLSARVAQKTLRTVMSAWDVAQIMSCIELTIPFRPKDETGRNAPERLFDRLSALELKGEVKPTSDVIERAVCRAIEVTNRDLWGFSSSDPALFLNGSWKLILEGNLALQRELHTAADYRGALEKMEGFFGFLRPEIIFQRFKDYPTQAVYDGIISQCRRNLESGRTYFQAKMLAMGVLEAIDDLSGGGSPIEAFRGDIASETNIYTATIEKFLDKRIHPVSELNFDQTVVDLLRVRSESQMRYDLKNSPLAMYIYTRLFKEDFHDAMSIARRYFKRAIPAIEFLKAFPTELRQSILNATIEISTSRKETLETIKKLFAVY